MAPASSRRGKRPADDSPDESDSGAPPSPGDYDSESSRRSQPRRRMNGGGVESDTDDSSTPAPPSTMPNGSQHPNGTQRFGQPGDSGFKPGSVICVTVNDFCAYTRAEFFPGPYLNMVIGPNGTGKSTLVNAICLGLGFSPKLLGRSDNVAEFVKNGKPSGFVEITLKGKGNEKNFVVRLKLRRDNNTSKFWVDDQESSQKKVQRLVREHFNIQVDNLCQFLPQDRVAAFAGMGEIELLDELLRAAAPEKIIKQHAHLKEQYNDLAGIQKTARENAERLEGHQNAKRNMQADVDRVNERADAQKNIDVLRAAVTAAQYTKEVASYQEAKEEKNRAAARVKQLEEANEPSLRAVKEREAYKVKVAAAVQHRKRVLADSEVAADRLLAAARNADDEVQRRDASITAQAEIFKKKKAGVAEARRAISQLELKLKSKPPAYDSSAWNLKIRSQEHLARDQQTQIDDLNRKVRGVEDDMRKKRNVGEGLKKQAEALDTREGQQVVALKRLDADAAKAWDWLQDHKDEFEKEVFGPPLLTCSVKDDRFSDHVQAMLQKSHLVCFTAQTKADQAKLSHQFIQVMGLSVSLRTFSGSMDEFKTTVRAQDYGFDGFAIDYLEGPPLLLAQFCSSAMLHKSGVSLQELTDAQYQKLDGQGFINSWASNRTLYKRTHRKEYGDAGKSTTTRDIQVAAFWKDQPVDSAERTELHEARARVKSEWQELVDQARTLKSEIQGLIEQKEEATKTLEGLKEEKNAIQTQYTRWKGLPGKIESEQKNQDQAVSEMREAKKEHSRLIESRTEANVQYLQATLKHSKHMVTMRAAHKDWLEASVRLIEAMSDVHGLQRRASAIIQQCDAERAKFQEAARATQEHHAEARRLRDEVQDLQTQYGEALTRLANGRTPEDVRDELGAEEEKLGMISDVPQNTLEKYNQVVAAIERLEASLEKVRGKVAQVTADIEELRARWEPVVDELVGRISEAFSFNFEGIGCSGEIRIHKDEDFEKWAVHILVSYREGEPLIRLTASRQSGGERTVATAFFLLALQGSAQAPFRVVDEINQGMDPRNERMVHNRMVEIACREHSSQYFLVTPKLLTGLRYEEGMTVLCVASGAHMPDEPAKLNLVRCLKAQKRVLRRQGEAMG